MIHALPKDFIESVLKDEFLPNSLLDALDTNSPTSIRVNHNKKVKLPYNNIKTIPWHDEGFYLEERPKFTLDPLFHAGCYYVQEAGSMSIELILNKLPLKEDPIILDLCAAPGGKSTTILSYLNNKGLLVSNEVIKSRANILAENIEKWGYSNQIVTNNDPEDFGKIQTNFDCILIDAPCSGEGMFRKDLKARDEWSLEHVQFCSSRQKRIISSVWDKLNEGGFLIYSTCTFNSSENENNIQWICNEFGANIVPIEQDFFSKGRENIGYYAFPDQVKSEGFYFCVLQKNSPSKKGKIKANKKPYYSIFKNNIPKLKIDSNFKLFSNHHNELFWFPSKFSNLVSDFENLFMISLGTKIGQVLKDKFIPAHGLAMSHQVNYETIKIKLSKEQALHFLKGNIFPIECTEKAYIVFTYEDIPLGFANNLGNRFNNLYPKHYRIRMAID